MDDMQGALDLTIRRPEKRDDADNEVTTDDQDRDICARKDGIRLSLDGSRHTTRYYSSNDDHSSENTKPSSDDIVDQMYKETPLIAESEDSEFTDTRKRHCRDDLRRRTSDADDKCRVDIRRRTLDADDKCRVDIRRRTSDADDKCRADVLRRISDTDDSSSRAIIRTVNGISVRLQEEDLWHSFRKLQTEMIINRGGRRMFPHIIVSIAGLESGELYSVAMEIVDADDRRYKYVNNKWLAMGIADPGSGRHVYVHPDSPASGAEWAKSYVSFAKVKLTNNKESNESILLHSMHKYRVMVTIKEEGNGGRVTLFDFPETTFIAVTAYQNNAITQLKIQSNPFAKAFRDITVAAKRSASDTVKCETRRKHTKVHNVFPHTGEINVPQLLMQDQQQLLSSQQPHFAMPPGLEYNFYGNIPSPYIPWLNFGHGFSLPAMMPLWFSNRKQCSAVTDLMSKNWHKVSEEHNQKSEESWHKIREEHNKSSTESWHKVSEEHNKSSAESWHNVSEEHNKSSAESWHKVSEEHNKSSAESWHKVSEEHNKSSTKTWHKVSDGDNKSLEESWHNVSETDDRNSEELNVSDNMIKEEASSDDIVLDV